MRDGGRVNNGPKDYPAAESSNLFAMQVTAETDNHELERHCVQIFFLSDDRTRDAMLHN